MDTSLYVDSGAGNDSAAEPVVKDIEARRPQHMAFTIHFDDTNKNCTKNINDKISNYALKHRRNQSLPYTEENKTTKGEVNSALAASLSPLSSGKSIATRVAGYHSEGYFSSDQEEDPRNRKGLFVRKLKNLEKGLRTTNLAQEKKNMADQTSRTKLNNSPHMSRHEFGDFPVEDTKLKSRLDELKYLNSGNNATYNPNKDEEAAKDEWLLASTTDNEIEAQPQNNLLDEFDDDNDNELSNDTASEAGTYTIDRDIPCLEEDLARQEIDNEITEMSASAQNVPDNDFKMSSCRNGSNWINDWATQVAEHTHYQQTEMHVSGLPPLPAEKHRASTTLTTRIPSPIHSPILPPSGRRHTPHSPTRPPHLADETESYLRATESVMTAMQARMSLSRDSGSESGRYATEGGRPWAQFGR